MLYKYGKRALGFGGRFYFYFSLVFYILRAFLIKQLFHSPLLDMRYDYSQLISNACSWNNYSKALHKNLYHTIENTLANTVTYDIRAAHDGKVGCNTVEYTTAFLYSDWLYFQWHGINSLKSVVFILCTVDRKTCFEIL